MHVLRDRMALATLSAQSPDLLETIRTLGGPKYFEKNTVHFCGLVGTPSGELGVFIPRNSTGLTDSTKDLKTACLTMQALARYGRETESRSGLEAGDEEPVSVLPVIHDLAQDFARYGLYAERLRYKSRDSGKPDWKSTISSEVPLLTKTGTAVYPDMRTTRVLDTRDIPLARIQAAIILEVSARHGWWLGDGFQTAARALAGFDKPRLPRALWPITLRQALNGLYATRPMALAQLLIRYLEEDQTVAAGTFLAGVPDFERVWETMLRYTLAGEETKLWNARLPKPAYVDHKGGVQLVPGRGMEMDIVLREQKEDADHLHILDAKYYAATGTGSVPKTGDIVKQLMYETAMKAAIENVGLGETVSGGFVFPSGGTHAQPFIKAGLTSGQTIDYRFPTIHIHYVDIVRVMSAYVARQTMRLDLYGISGNDNNGS